MPKEQIIHQHITNVERPSQDIDTLLKTQLENTEQRMTRDMQNKFGKHGNLINHLAGRIDDVSRAAHAIANKDPILVQGPAGVAGAMGPPGVAGRRESWCRRIGWTTRCSRRRRHIRRWESRGQEDCYQIEGEEEANFRDGD